MSSTLKHFESLVDNHDFVFVVFYRGHWCPFCEAYLRDFQTIVPAIRKAGGLPIVITAEKEEFQQPFLRKTGLDAEGIVDTKNEIAAELKRRNMINVAISDKSGYPNGMAQPAVLVLKQDGTVLHSWAIVPGLMNLGGAKDRPALQEIWEDVEKLRADETYKARTQYHKQGFLGVMSKHILG